MICPICSNASASREDVANASEATHKITCFKCGEFFAGDSFINSIPASLSEKEKSIVSGWVFNNPGIALNNSHWDHILSLEELSIAEKSDLLLNYLAKKFPKPNQELSFQGVGTEESACYAIDRDEANYIFHRYLRDYKGFISNPTHGGQPIVISPAGWDHIHTLKQVNSASKKAFCAMWFDDSVQSLWLASIAPAISELGYEPIRIDEHQHNNKIDDEIIAMIKKSKFVIADFTGNRGGVYFEAGYALGLGIPVIWTVSEDDLKNIHFDNRQYNFLVWKPNNLSELKQKLQARIEATVGLPK